MWEPSPLHPPLSWALWEESTDGAPPPAGASGLCQLGPRVGRKEQLFSGRPPPSLESGEGVKWGELLFQEEEGRSKSLTCPPPPRPPCWAGLLPSLKLGRREVIAHGVCLAVSTPAGISPSMLWSLSPGKPSRASPYRNCECGCSGGKSSKCVCDAVTVSLWNWQGRVALGTPCLSES